MSEPSILIEIFRGAARHWTNCWHTPTSRRMPARASWFAGDIVNRGPQSLTTLRRLMALEERSVAILGNHDLHLLAVAAGVRRPGKNDTLLEVLEAPDANEIIDWLRQRPLAHLEAGHLMVHAGVLAKWDVSKRCNSPTKSKRRYAATTGRKCCKKCTVMNQITGRTATAVANGSA